MNFWRCWLCRKFLFVRADHESQLADMYTKTKSIFNLPFFERVVSDHGALYLIELGKLSLLLTYAAVQCVNDSNLCTRQYYYFNQPFFTACHFLVSSIMFESSDYLFYERLSTYTTIAAFKNKNIFTSLFSFHNSSNRNDF